MKESRMGETGSLRRSVRDVTPTQNKANSTIFNAIYMNKEIVLRQLTKVSNFQVGQEGISRRYFDLNSTYLYFCLNPTFILFK